MDVLQSIVKLWTTQIRRAEKSRGEKFDKVGDEAWSYLNADYKTLYLKGKARDGGDFEGPMHKVRVNKSAEFVKLYLPFIHHKVPHRLVAPSRPQLPPEVMGMAPGTPMPLNGLDLQDKMRAWLMQFVLNYTPDQYDLRYEARKALPEALVRGRCLLWHRMFDSPTGPMAGSFFESVKDLLIDPDCRQLREAGWVALRRQRSIWKVAEEFGIPRDELKAKYKTSLQRSNEEAAGVTNIDSADELDSGDVIEYWEVYSRMGIGSKFTTADPDVKKVAERLDEQGPYVYLCICPGVPYPLNLPPHVAGSPDPAGEYKQRLQWPIPLYENPSDPWPFSQLDFLPSSEHPWASSPLEGALSLQRFVDNVYSYICGRTRAVCRDIVVASSALDADIQKALEGGIDQELVIANGAVGEDIRKLIHVIQFPPANADLWTVLQIAENAFERASGMSPLLSGMEGRTQVRSSAEAQIRQDNASSQPEDFAECCERWMSNIAAKEAAMTRLMVGSTTIAPLFGEQVQQNQWDPSNPVASGPISQAWTQLVNTVDPAIAAGELSYTVEAGSGRRKNKGKQAADSQMVMQSLGTPAMQALMAGMPQPWNAMVRMMGDAFDIRVDDFMMPMPPQQAPPQQQAGPQQQQAAQPQQTGPPQ